MLLVCLNKREFTGIFIRQLLHRIHTASSFLLWAYSLIGTYFRKIGLVSCFQSLRCLIELLLTYFLRSQSGIQVLNILLIAGVLAGLRKKFLRCSLSLNGVGRVPFFGRILTGKCYLLFGGSFPERLLRIQYGLLAAQLVR